MTLALARRTAFYGYLSLLTLVSLLPGGDLPSISYNDKVAHFVAYLILAVLAAGLTKSPRVFAKICVALCIYGVLLELLQGLSGLRHPETLDAIANGAGVLMGCLVRIRYWRAPR